MAKNEKIVATVNTVSGNAVIDRLGNALAINLNDYYEEVPTKDGTTEISKKVYEFANPIGKRTQITVYDMAIIESTEKISKALHGRSILNYVICKEFSKIAESGKLENMGFKNIAEFGKAIFGLEPSTVNHYTRIGKAFINDDYTVKAGLPELSVSHFIELNALVGENGDISAIIELYQTGKLVDGMSTKKIREVLTASKNPQIDDKSSEAKEDNSSEAKEGKSSESKEDKPITASNVEEYRVNFDKQVVVGQILNTCNIISQLFSVLSENNVTATGYEDSLEVIKNLAKELLK